MLCFAVVSGDAWNMAVFLKNYFVLIELEEGFSTTKHTNLSTLFDKWSVWMESNHSLFVEKAVIPLVLRMNYVLKFTLNLEIVEDVKNAAILHSICASKISWQDKLGVQSTTPNYPLRIQNLFGHCLQHIER